jgi:uncharacterized protein YcbX
MIISSLHRYPIKGCRGQQLKLAEFDKYGVQHDRRLMLVDINDRFVSQREVPMLATVDPTIDKDVLKVVAAGLEPFTQEIDTAGAVRTVTLWRDTISVIDQGDQAAAWFSEVASQPLRLVAWGASSSRPLDPQYTPHPGAEVTFADGYPVLVACQASLADLNQRLADPIPMNRFRPTVVIEGGLPWQEDAWRVVSIGSMTFDAVKPCARCAVPSVDQDTGERRSKAEPLRTLAAFRTIPGLGAIFGQNLVHRDIGSLTVGDSLEPIM